LPPPRPLAPSRRQCTPPPHIPTLSLHDALPISQATIASSIRTSPSGEAVRPRETAKPTTNRLPRMENIQKAKRGRSPPRSTPKADRKSTRLNSSHVNISYAVFCLKKENARTAVQ